MKLLYIYRFWINNVIAEFLLRWSMDFKKVSFFAYLMAGLTGKLDAPINDTTIFMVVVQQDDNRATVVYPAWLHPDDIDLFIKDNEEKGRTVIFCQSIRDFREEAAKQIVSRIKERDVTV